jgi:hypothetical protein
MEETALPDTGYRFYHSIQIDKLQAQFIKFILLITHFILCMKSWSAPLCDHGFPGFKMKV